MSTPAKIIIGIVIAVVILGVSCVGGVIALGLWVQGNVPEGIVLEFDYPDDIIVGDEFDITITIKNLLDQDRDLGDLDFYDPILDGVRIVSFDPNYESSEQMEMIGSNTYVYNRTVPAEGEFKVVVTMVAVEAGYYTGDVDVTIDGLLSIYSTTQTLVINEAED